MDQGILTRFNRRLRFPIRHKKSKRHGFAAPDPVCEPPPSYNDCSKLFYPPPSYEESVRQPATRLELRHSTGRIGWGASRSSSTTVSVPSSVTSSAHSLRSASLFATPTEVIPTAPPPLSPEPSSATASSALSHWLSAVSSSTSSPRSVANSSGQRHGWASPSVSSVGNHSSAPDVVTRIQPRTCSWTQCMRWVVQYTLESNFKSTVAHFKCLVNEGLRIAENYEADSEMCPIRLASLAVPRPTTLSLKTWVEFILCMGFQFSQCSVVINNNNNNINNNNNSCDNHNYNNRNDNDFCSSNSMGININANAQPRDGEGDSDNDISFVTGDINFANSNNSNDTSMSDSLEALCVVVPRGLTAQTLRKYRGIFTGLMELPYCAIKTAANMSRTESERIVALLTSVLQSSHHTCMDYTLPVDHALVRSIWDVHRRPGFFLKSLDFSEFRRAEGGKSLDIPTGVVARRRLQLAKDILEMFLRN